MKRPWAPGAQRTDGHFSRHGSCLARAGRGAGRRRQAGVDAAVAFAERNWEPSTPVLGEPVPPPGMGTGMEMCLNVLHKGQEKLLMVLF